MAALPAVLAADPRAVAVIAGDNRVCYGGDGLRAHRLEGTGAGGERHRPARIRFAGTLDPALWLRLLQRSDAHVYLTVPFVLSWSMLEAMATGCAIVASDTAPVREFAGRASAALVDHARPAAIAEAIVATLAGPAEGRRGGGTGRGARAGARGPVARGVAGDRCRLAQAGVATSVAGGSSARGARAPTGRPGSASGAWPAGRRARSMWTTTRRSGGVASLITLLFW